MTASPAPITPPQRDIVIWRGDNEPAVKWCFGDASTPDVLVGSTFELTVRWAGAVDDMVLRSEDPGTTLTVDEAARTVAWAYTAGESLELPRGGHSYELRRIVGDRRRTWVWGTLSVMSGLRRG